MADASTVNESVPVDELPHATGVAHDPALPRRFFPQGQHNPGFAPPQYLLDEGLARELQPPASVRTFETKLEESHTEEERQIFNDFWESVVVANGWHEKGVDKWKAMRFLVARQFKLNKATKILEAHMEWLAEMRPERVWCSACAQDPKSHMMQFVGWDQQHRPIMYLSYLQCEERQDPAKSIEHNLMTFRQFEDHLMPEGVEQWVSVTDFVTFSQWRDGRSSVGKQVVQMMQDHYPERLGMQILVDPPTSFWVLWKLLSPFIDERTKQKVKFMYTQSTPSIHDEFPKLFTKPVSDFLIRRYVNNRLIGAGKPPLADDEPVDAGTA